MPRQPPRDRRLAVIARAVARMLSIGGHPALLVPTAVAASAARRGASQAVLLAAVGGAVAVALIVAAYSAWQVRTDRWSHVDASHPPERLNLNRLLAGLLTGAATLAWATGQPAGLAAGAAACAGLVGVALLLRQRMKVSLHAAFASFAAALLWPDLRSLALLGALALAVGWSRVRLGRHSRREVLVGLACGGLAGLAFHQAAG